MAKKSMDELLKKRMSATQQASELEVGNEAYEKLFQAAHSPTASKFCELSIDRLRPFFTADIGFHPYPPEKLKAFSQQLSEQGIYERIIVRPIPNDDHYEILAGHNRTAAWNMNGHSTIPAEIVEADDAQAISIATATNLLRRQDLTIIERGKAYKAMLEAKNKNGQHNACGDNQTFGDSRQRYNAREIVAAFFGVTEYEIRKAIKMTQLIPELQEILENRPKALPVTCAEKIADFDADSQCAFIEMCSIEGYQLNMAMVSYIVQKCPPPCADKQLVYAAWREARATEDRRRMAPPKEIRFNRKRFAPYLDKLGSDVDLEDLFLEFLKSRIG